MSSNVDITLSFRPDGTNYGDGTRTGDFSNITITKAGNFPIPSGLINNTNICASQSFGTSLGANTGIAMYSIWAPTTQTSMYALATFTAGTTGTFSLANPTITANASPFEISTYKNNTCIMFDYGRPITLSGTNPYTAIVSGFDYYGAPTVVRVDAINVGAGVNPWKATTCRGIKYLTNVKVINSGVADTSVTMGVDNMVELPYNDLGRQSNFLMWNQMSNFHDGAGVANQTKNISVGVDAVTFFYGGINSGAYTTLPGSYIPSSWDPLYDPITLTAGNPRPIVNLAGAQDVYFTPSGSGTNGIIINTFAQNVFGFGNLPQYKNASFDYSIPSSYANNKETVYGRKNYTDSNWAGWAG